MQKKSPILSITLTGVTAAIIYLIMMFRLPIPGSIGAPFVHFGNTAMVLAILLLGIRNGMLASAIGLGLFDLLNGYAQTAIFTICEAIVVALVVGGIFKLTGKNDTSILRMYGISFLAGFTKIVTSYFSSLLQAIILYGVAFKPAAISAFTNLPASIVNAIAVFILVPLLYYPLKKILPK